MTRLRVACWNMNHWRQPTHPVNTRAQAWTYLASELDANVALVQEAVPPPSIAAASRVYREIAGNRSWGSAVVALDQEIRVEEIWSVRTPFSRRRFTLTNTYPGSVAVAQVSTADIAPITMVSLYGVIDVYAQTTLLRVIADLIPLFDSALGSRVILGGDLNMSTATADPYYRRRSEGILGALKSLGLVEVTDFVERRPPSIPDCPCGLGDSCRHLPTWHGTELDHIYVTPTLVDQAQSLDLAHEAVARGLSDHAPLVLELELSHQPQPREWDCPTFVEEVGRRYGASIRRAVDTLVRWAETTEVRLRGEGRSDVELTRFPCSSGVDPQMWFQIDYTGPVPALMWTVSIRTAGEGDVVVQFQWMRQAPFDTEAGREVLRGRLNEIEGVHLAPEQLSGRPSFPLRVLERPEAVEQLIGVLQQVVEETRPSTAPVAESEGLSRSESEAEGAP